MKRLIKITWLVIRKLRLGFVVLAIHPKSILIKDGWFKSFRSASSVDANGKPIPWYTYSFIHFLEPRLPKNLRVFEYGSGNSTLWFAERVREVIAVEHDKDWAIKVGNILPENGQVIYQSEVTDYTSEVSKHGKFDVIAIDGIERETCAEQAIHALTDNGVLIWDNSDREDFQSSLPMFLSHGYCEIPFYGLPSVTFVNSQTSIIYRRGRNFLGL